MVIGCRTRDRDSTHSRGRVFNSRLLHYHVYGFRYNDAGAAHVVHTRASCHQAAQQSRATAIPGTTAQMHNANAAVYFGWAQYGVRTCRTNRHFINILGNYVNKQKVCQTTAVALI